MNPSPREIRVLFVPPAWRESSTSLRTPLTPSETPRRFPQSPSVSTSHFTLASNSTQRSALTLLSRRVAIVVGGFHSFEISRSQYSSFSPFITGTTYHLISPACVRFSTSGKRNKMQFRKVIGATVVSKRVAQRDTRMVATHFRYKKQEALCLYKYLEYKCMIKMHYFITH